MTPELIRLQAAREQKIPWKQWGPYLSERQWGTVREDYSESGDAWGYFTHDHARLRAYHWGEDGLAGLSDDRQFLLRNEQGQRPVYGGTSKFQDDPHWRDYILFYEYFHGDNGAGLGASHQIGWTGVVARLIQLFGATTAEQVREAGFSAAAANAYHD